MPTDLSETSHVYMIIPLPLDAPVMIIVFALILITYRTEVAVVIISFWDPRGWYKYCEFQCVCTINRHSGAISFCKQPFSCFNSALPSFFTTLDDLEPNDQWVSDWLVSIKAYVY